MVKMSNDRKKLKASNIIDTLKSSYISEKEDLSDNEDDLFTKISVSNLSTV